MKYIKEKVIQAIAEGNRPLNLCRNSLVCIEQKCCVLRCSLETLIEDEKEDDREAREELWNGLFS